MDHCPSENMGQIHTSGAHQSSHNFRARELFLHPPGKKGNKASTRTHPMDNFKKSKAQPNLHMQLIMLPFYNIKKTTTRDSGLS